MTNIVRSLLIAAGGKFEPGNTLYRYWFDLAVELDVRTGHKTTIRTLEVAWREKRLSHQLKIALQKLAHERARQNDDKFIEGVAEWLDWFALDAPVSSKEDVATARAVIPVLKRIAALRGRIAISQSLIEAALAASGDGTSEAAE